MDYNCRLYDYPAGQHVTFYKKSIHSGELKNKNFKKTYQRERTEKEEKHCISVSLKNTKNRIYQIARSNTWEWFITLTFDRTKTDASDYDTVVGKLTQYLNNFQKRKCPAMKYLIVPELHADGEHYHFHGLLSDCDGLHFSYSGHNDRKSGKPIFNIKDWTLGFTTATRVQDTGKVSSYITKYMTKSTVKYLKNKKRYYASHNINIVEPEYMVEDEEEFQRLYADRITYCKTVDIPEAHQRVTYYELRD